MNHCAWVFAEILVQFLSMIARKASECIYYPYEYSVIINELQYMTLFNEA